MPEEDSDILLGLPQGVVTSRGTDSAYHRRQGVSQGPAAGVANVPPQRLRPEVPGPAAEPTLLPRARMPEGTAPLAGGQASTETPRRREGRRQHAEAERRRRQRKAEQTKTAKADQATDAAFAKPARGHAAEKHPEVFCDRPGCYEAVRESPCAPACYCGDDCRTAVNRVRDRERKGLLRKRPVGRINANSSIGRHAINVCHPAFGCLRSRTFFAPRRAAAGCGRKF